MKLQSRTERFVRRAQKSSGLFAARSRRECRAFDRWFSGIHVENRTASNGMVYWERVPTGHGLIHKGRKP